MFKKIGNWLITIAFIAIILIIIFSAFKGCNKNTSSTIDVNQKSIDSLNVLFQKSQLKVDKYESDIKFLNKELLIAQNNSQVAETKYYELKNRKVKPIYIENISDCNDTIQTIYKYAIEKDSLCEKTIHSKNEVIRVQDAIIKENDSIKKEHKFMIVNQSKEVKNLNEIIEIEQKQLRKEKLIKNGYKIGFVALLIKTLFFK